MGKRFVGIDVSQDYLDVYVHPLGEGWRLPNTGQGRAELAHRLAEHEPQLVVLEASGGLQRPVAEALREAKVPVAVMNPRQVRDFAKALGYLAKTDVLDAEVLADLLQLSEGEAAEMPLPWGSRSENPRM